jgi:hypothetical protein
MIPVNPGQAGKQFLGQRFMRVVRYSGASGHGRYISRVKHVPVVEEALALKPDRR